MKVKYADTRHGHPRAWMTILLASSAAMIILVMSIAALQLASILTK